MPRVLLALALAAAAAPAAGASGRAELRFGDHLGLGDLRLAGARASRAVGFWCDPQWKVQPGAELRLVVEHSPALDGERSFLALSLNNGVLRSLRLDATNTGPFALVVPIPAAMLQEENRLVISVQQPSPAPGRDSWTVVRAQSTLVIPYERRAPDHGLAALPEPLLRRRSYEPRRLTVLLPVKPSLETLEATALTVANLSARVAPEPIALGFARSLDEIDAPALAVGTPREQPALQGIGIAEPVRVLKGAGGAALAAAGEALPVSTGLLLLAPSAGPRAQPLLVVSGPSAAAVRRAARGLFRAPRGPRDRLVLVAEEVPPSARRRREWDGFLPPRDRFTLSEVGDPDAEWSVSLDSPARVALRATPDARFLPHGHRVSLDFTVLPALREDPDARLDVTWNGILLRRQPMRDHTGHRALSLSIAVPARLLARENALTVEWRGRSGASGPFLVLQEDSNFYLPREYAASLPDLALLRESLFPFSLRSDLAGTVVVPPPEQGDDTVALLAELAAFLGRMSPASELAFTLQASGDVARARPKADLIVLESGASGPLFPLPDWKALRRGDALARVPMLQERRSPWSDEHHVLRLRARSPALLRVALRNLGQPAALAHLSEDTAFLTAEGVLPVRLSPKHARAEVSYLTRLEAWLRANWLALPLILALVSLLLFLALRLTLGHRGTGAGRADAGGESPA